jgi:hypothetical protein
MGYDLEKNVWVLFFNKGLIMHLYNYLGKVNGPALLKERWIKGLAGRDMQIKDVFFFLGPFFSS